MLLELIVSLVLGILFGTFTGLIPGIHINLIGAFIVSGITSSLFPINPIYLIVFIPAMAITHTFIDFIPSILIGSPDTETELSVLPGHEMLKKGKGYEAILFTCYGSITAIFILLIIAIPSKILLEKNYDKIIILIPYLLIFIIISLILMEKKKINALFVVLLTGILGLCVLNLENVKEPLLPLLTGLFGSSTLIISIKNKIKIPEQKITKPKKPIRIKPIIGSLLASPICCFLPGIGASQAAIIGNTITRINKKDIESFLFLIGSVNTLVMGLSFVAFHAISRTRTGAAVAINQITGGINFKILLFIIIIIFITGLISFNITKKISSFFIIKMNKINYKKLSIITLLILTLIIILFSKITGFLVFIISTITGIYCISLKVRRTNMMGCLMIPTIIFYLFL